jgi:small subunit ribosomal protein S8
MVTDSVADLIVRLKNAGMVEHQVVSVPHSKFLEAIVSVLKEKGFVKDFEVKGKKVRKSLDITLAYDAQGTPKIKGTKRLSKPGRRLYRSSLAVHQVRYGHGALILSTPKGVLADAEARKEKVGGEALFEIW